MSVCFCVYVGVCLLCPVGPWPWSCVSGPRNKRLTEFSQDVIDVSPFSMCLCMSVCAVVHKASHK